ncbi:unnamed protein product [Hymenolepis diminuta]|uniref:UV excision repair protein RAD23 n=1 Tax=Hymenolepis diminuta TaxID=6216 RepID=A0A0R3SR66_HYMDI|nr:unnamed protein product [Hymenolepis diminuta]VUZ54907.1 unnamed protein product [Hymenolepis diminuta]
MRLTFKTLKNTTFVLDVEESEKVSEVKEKIKSVQSKDYGDSNLKLICSGKVMDDEKTIKEYSIGEKNFIVVMSTVAKPEKKEPKPEPIKKPEPTPAPDTASSKTSTATSAPNPVEPNASATGTSDLLSGQSLASAIQNLMEMGFERSQVEQALRMSFNNPDRAAEYLLSGNVAAEEPSQPTTGTTEQQPSETQQTVGLDPESLRSLSSDELVQLLSTIPQFQQLRALRGNSAALAEFMQQLSVSYPELINAIQENEGAFLDFVNSDPDPSAEPDAPSGGGRHHVIRLTEEEKNAVDRLKALGFPEHEVIQAYFACDKNEELAANLLFSDNPDE